MFLRRACLTLAGIVAVAVVAADGAVAQNAFSERIVRQIEDARNAAKARNYDDALDIYRRAVDDAAAAGTQNVGKVLRNRATLYEQLQMFTDAEADFTSALAASPGDPNIYADRGYFYMRRNRMPDALSEFMSGARLAPDDAKFYYGAGRVQSALMNFNAAIEFYTDAIAADPANARAFLARAEAFVRIARWPQARTDYDRAIELTLKRRSDQYFAHLGRGYVGLVQGDFAAAIANLDAALAIEPTAMRALMWRGYAQEKQGRPDLAIGDFERAVALDRRDAAARRNLERLRSASAAPLAPPRRRVE